MKQGMQTFFKRFPSKITGYLSQDLKKLLEFTHCLKNNGVKESIWIHVC